MSPRITVRKKRNPNRPTVPKGPTRVKVGFPRGTSSAELDKAVFNNFGTEDIPERPFMSNAIEDNKSNYRRAMRRAAPKILSGKETLARTLSKLGIYAEGHIKVEITELRIPGNAPATIKQKGSSNPLIEHGTMRAAVTHKVEK